MRRNPNEYILAIADDLEHHTGVPLAAAISILASVIALIAIIVAIVAR